MSDTITNKCFVNNASNSDFKLQVKMSQENHRKKSGLSSSSYESGLSHFYFSNQLKKKRYNKTVI